MSVPLDSATMHFTLGTGVVTITDAELRYHGAAISVSGTVTYDQRTLSPQHVALTVTAHDLNLDEFTTLVACDNPRAGHFTSDARLQLPFDVAGHFFAKRDPFRTVDGRRR